MAGVGSLGTYKGSRRGAEGGGMVNTDYTSNADN
jgi:hypothetical protein